MKKVKLNQLITGRYMISPEFNDPSTETEVLVTGIKVGDLLAPYARGKIGHFSGAGVVNPVLIVELINNVARMEVFSFAGVGERTREVMIFSWNDKSGVIKQMNQAQKLRWFMVKWTNLRS